MESIERFDYKGFVVKIYADDDLESPRKWDNLGTMVCFHGRYDLGDKPGEKHDWTKKDLSEFEKFLQHDNVISLPLFLFDHSGITMSTDSTNFHACDSHGWDWGQVGWIYVTKEDLRKEYGWKLITKARREKILQYLVNEVTVYDQFLTGDVYYYLVINSKMSDEVVDSCCGFYGLEYAIESAKDAVDYHFKKEEAA